jgi:hypothetical protein
MVAATLYTNYDRGYGFSSSYTLTANCRTLLLDKIYQTKKELAQKKIIVLKIVYHNGQNEIKSQLICNL